MSAVQTVPVLRPVPPPEVPWVSGRPVPTWVACGDPISREGVLAQLRARPEVTVVPESRSADALVAVVVAERLDEAVTRSLREVRRRFGRIVLVVTTLDDAGVVAAAEAGVLGLLRRSDTSPEALAHAVERVALGHGELPADLVGRLLGQVGRLQRQVLAPRGLVLAGLSPREADVVRLCADGLDTAAISRELCWSERTVKNVLHDVTVRLRLRNRTHVVAYALREGLI